MKKLVMGAVGALIAIVGVLAWRIGRGGEAAEPRTSTAKLQLEVAVQQGERAEVAPSAEQGEARRCVGRVVLEGIEGEERESFGLLFVELLDAKGERTRSERVEVREGKFELEVRSGESELDVERFESDGWVAEALGKRVKVEPEFEVRVKWRAGVELRVVERGRGRELAGVSLVTAMDPTGSGRVPKDECPPEGDLRIEWASAAMSPIRLPATVDTAVVWVGANGKAWQRVALSGREGTRTVELGPGAALALEWGADVEAREKLELVVERADGAPLLRRAVAAAPGARVSFDGLPVGPFRARVNERKLGQWHELAACEGEVSAGAEFEWRIGSQSVETRVAQLEVVVEARAFPPGRTPTHAELRPQFDSNDPRRTRPVLKLPLEPRPTEGAHVSARHKLAPGRWRLTLVPLNIVREIELAPGDERTERFVFGDPAQLILEVQDAATGERLDDAKVRFGWIDSGERAVVLDNVARDSNSPLFVIAAPSGRIDLSVSAPRHVTRRLPVDLPAVTAPFIVRLEPSEDLEVRFELRRGDALVPIAPDLWSKVSLDAAKSSGSLVRLAFQSNGTDTATPYLTLVVSRSGAYELLVPALITGSTPLSIHFTAPATSSAFIPIPLP